MIGTRHGDAHTPAVRSGREIEFRDVGSRPYQIVLRLCASRRGRWGDRHAERVSMPVSERLDLAAFSHSVVTV
jgi:hypothetical protein